MFLTPWFALLWVSEVLLGHAIELLQRHFGGNEFEIIGGGVLFVLVVPLILALAGDFLGWWLIRRVVSWEVAQQLLLDVDGNPKPGHTYIVGWYRANNRGSGT